MRKGRLRAYAIAQDQQGLGAHLKEQVKDTQVFHEASASEMELVVRAKGYPWYGICILRTQGVTKVTQPRMRFHFLRRDEVFRGTPRHIELKEEEQGLQKLGIKVP